VYFVTYEIHRIPSTFVGLGQIISLEHNTVQLRAWSDLSLNLQNGWILSI